MQKLIALLDELRHARADKASFREIVLIETELIGQAIRVNSNVTLAAMREIYQNRA